MGEAIYIIKTMSEAELVKNLKLGQGIKILSLTPAIEKVLRQNSNSQILTTYEAYDDTSHMQSVTRVDDCIIEFQSIAESLGTLSKLQSEVTLYNIFYIYSAASFFYEVMKGYQKFYFFANGKLVSSEQFDQAFVNIMSDFFNTTYANKDHNFSALHRLIMGTYNSFLSNKMKSKKKLLILDGGRTSSKKFAAEILKQDKDFIILKSQSPSKSIITTIRRTAKSLRSKNYIYFLYPAKPKNFDAELNQIINRTRSQFHKLTLQSAKPFIQHLLSNTHGYETHNQMQNLKPQIVTSDIFYKPASLVTAKEAAKQGAKVIAFDHASHSPQQNIISKKISNLWCLLGRVWNPYATHMIARAPATAALITEIASITPIGLRTNKKIDLFLQKEKFNFLFAGNYLPIETHVPWIVEDAYEFTKGIDELIHVIAKLPNATLTIRIKEGKNDFDMDKLREAIKPYPNIEINNSGTFKDALTKADIMTANISTTIDEALQSGVPVLLHSWCKRYRHLPAMTAPPTQNNRSAVYASSHEILLAHLLQNIITAHHHKPLTDAELSPYIWPENTADMQSLVKQILETSV